jgi:putative tryptophan/tyrosine transport system substrate-binding protein
MRRREFITLLGGAAAAWPLAARAQQGERVRRICVLMPRDESDPEAKRRLSVFTQALADLGWTDGRNVRIDIRWSAGDSDRRRRYAAELVALAPDIIVADTSPAVAALQHAIRTVPIVFAGVIDPVGAGFVKSLARPGGNITGFASFEYAIGAKWLEILKEIAPSVTRAAVLRDSTLAAGIGQFAAIQAVGPIGMELNVIDLQDVGAIERDIGEFARGSNSGLVVTAGPFGANNPGVIAALAARYKLPAVYPFRYYVSAGGLISYGTETVGPLRSAASYVDRILKGEKPADLPVQAPTKYELVINLKAAKADRLDVAIAVLKNERKSL